MHFVLVLRLAFYAWCRIGQRREELCMLLATVGKDNWPVEADVRLLQDWLLLVRRLYS